MLKKTFAKSAVLGLGLAGSLALSACGAIPDQGASGFPNRTIEFIVPFGAGGASDIAARTIADVMGGLIDPNITISNVPGGGTAVGMMQAYNQPADGYTVFFLTPSAQIVESQQQAPVNFSEAFVPLAMMQIDALALSIHRDNGRFSNIDELIAYGRANPGSITIGGQSPRGLHDFIANGFAAAAGIEITFVPYDSAGEQLSAMLGGEIDVYLENVSALSGVLAANPYVNPILVLHTERITTVEEVAHVPASVEIGIDFSQGSWRALAVRYGTPQEIIDTLENLLYQVYRSDEYQHRASLENSNYISGWRTAAETAVIWEQELAAFTYIFN